MAWTRHLKVFEIKEGTCNNTAYFCAEGVDNYSNINVFAKFSCALACPATPVASSTLTCRSIAILLALPVYPSSQRGHPHNFTPG